MRRWWLWVPVWAHVVLIYGSSSMPGSAVPSVLPDKPVHGAVFGLLAGLLLRALAGGRWAGVTAGTAAAAVAITIAYGASDEWHQSFVPGRTPELGDFVVDGLAATVVVLTAWAWSIIVVSRAHATRRAGHAAPTSTE